jgi:hypothetical protein
VSAFAQTGMNKLSINPIELIVYNHLNMEFERGFHNGRYGVSFYMGRTGNASRAAHGQYSFIRIKCDDEILFENLLSGRIST